jgi:hypothetical protein
MGEGERGDMGSPAPPCILTLECAGVGICGEEESVGEVGARKEEEEELARAVRACCSVAVSSGIESEREREGV